MCVFVRTPFYVILYYQTQSFRISSSNHSFAGGPVLEEEVCLRKQRARKTPQKARG